MRAVHSFALAISLAAIAAACAPQPAAEAPSPAGKAIIVEKPGVNTALPAPAVPGAVTRIRAADAGKTITVSVGETFQIELVGVPTAGYLWAPKATPAFLEKTAEIGGATTTAQRQPGFAGGNHWEVFAFRATAAGTGVVQLEQRRPWEKTEPPSNSFSVTITAR
jgi:predicted secreted protein